VISASGYADQRQQTAPIFPGNISDLGTLYLARPGAIQADISFPREIPAGPFDVAVYRRSPIDGHADLLGHQTLTPTRQVSVTFPNLGPTRVIVTFSLPIVGLYQEAEVIVQPQQLARFAMTFSPIALRGIVMQAGRPSSGALLRIAQRQRQVAELVAGPDGEYETTLWSPGEYTITARAEDHGGPSATTIVARQNATTITQVITLPNQHLAGTVTAEDGQTPVPNVEVLYRIDAVESEHSLSMRTLTASDGSFKFTDLPEQEGALVFKSPGFAATTLRGVFPSRGTPLHISLQQGRTIRGIVADSEGQPVGEATVGVGHDHDTGTFAAETRTSRTGEFTLHDVAADQEQLVAFKCGYTLSMTRGASGTTMVFIRLTRATTPAHLRFLDANGKTLTAHRIAIAIGEFALPVNEFAFFMYSCRRSATPDENGSIFIDWLPGGPISVQDITANTPSWHLGNDKAQTEWTFCVPH
jgi:hypothetical protein